MLIPFGVFSAGAGGGDSGGGSFDLISTTLLTGSQASVTFDVTGLGATYKHLQLRMVGRATGTSVNTDFLGVQFNDVTASGNYKSHTLTNAGSSVTSGTYGETNMIGIQPGFAGGGNPTGTQGVVVLDILDFASTSKNKTTRSMSGNAATSAYQISLESGLWLSTSAITSVKVISLFGNSFAATSRFSIYGIKG